MGWTNVLLKDHNTVTPVRLEPVALRSRVKHYTTSHCAPIKKFKNNLDPGQATMVVFPDIMYTFRNTQGRWGVKIDKFSHS